MSANEPRKQRKVSLDDEEFRFCLQAAKLEHIEKFSPWARKVLLEAATATSRGVRK